jgi:hypothetical protein
MWARFRWLEMSFRGPIRVLALVLTAAVAALSLAVSSVSAVTDCSVTVAPRAGAAGTVFVFRGAGFVPATLVLEKNGMPAGEHTLDVDSAESWEVSVRSRPS